MKKNGFTLIELLIVVAIIAILAAIAVPNFLEAQTRSKVSRTKADMRSMKTAYEAYFVDNNRYPEGRDCNNVFAPGWPEGPVKNRAILLTTPIAYITSIPDDPWGTNFSAVPMRPCDQPSFVYLLFKYHATPDSNGIPTWYLGLIPGVSESTPLFATDPEWTIWSRGMNPQYILVSDGPWREKTDGVSSVPYDATNGTVSFGQIFAWGPG